MLTVQSRSVKIIFPSRPNLIFNRSLCWETSKVFLKTCGVIPKDLGVSQSLKMPHKSFGRLILTNWKWEVFPKMGVPTLVPSEDLFEGTSGKINFNRLAPDI